MSSFRQIATTLRRVQPPASTALAQARPTSPPSAPRSARYSSLSGAPTCGRGLRKAVSACPHLRQRPPTSVGVRTDGEQTALLPFTHTGSSSANVVVSVTDTTTQGGRRAVGLGRSRRAGGDTSNPPALSMSRPRPSRTVSAARAELDCQRGLACRLHSAYVQSLPTRSAGSCVCGFRVRGRTSHLGSRAGVSGHDVCR